MATPQGAELRRVCVPLGAESRTAETGESDDDKSSSDDCDSLESDNENSTRPNDPGEESDDSFHNAPHTYAQYQDPPLIWKKGGSRGRREATVCEKEVRVCVPFVPILCTIGTRYEAARARVAGDMGPAASPRTSRCDLPYQLPP